jgi:AcrR family transcriptional regulator
MPKRTISKPADQYHHGDLRRSLVAAALEIIEKEGLDALSLRAVARRANVSHTAPYHHFASRAELLAAVAGEGFHALGETIARRVDGIDDPRASFIEGCVGYVLFAIAHPFRYKLMFSAELASASSEPLQDASSTAFGALVAAIERCQSADLARDGDPRTLARAAWSMIHGLSLLLLDGHFRDPKSGRAAGERTARAMLETLWEGMSL